MRLEMNCEHCKLWAACITRDPKRWCEENRDKI